MTETSSPALLEEQQARYLANMGDDAPGLAYWRLGNDQIIALAALDAWSAGVLQDGGAISLGDWDDDPACATTDEVVRLVRLLHQDPVPLYPVSGFDLADDGTLRFQHTDATYRMRRPDQGTRADALAMADGPVWDAAAVMRLWTLCATADCIAYLEHQMGLYDLGLDREAWSAMERIVGSALQEHFSIGQVRNAVWRTVKDAAALSRRQYYNTAKASKTILRKLDRHLATAIGDPGFEHYQRIEETPIGAVLLYMRKRFGFDDRTSGPEVFGLLQASAESGCEAPAYKDITTGRLFFGGTLSDFDERLVALLDPDAEVLWSHGGRGSVGYVRSDLTLQHGLIRAVFTHLGVAPPDLQVVPNDPAVLAAALRAGGIDTDRATTIAGALWRCVVPSGFVALVRSLGIASSLLAVQEGFSYVDDGCFVAKMRMATEDLSIELLDSEERAVEEDVPLWHQAVVESLGFGDDGALASLLARRIWRSITTDPSRKSALMTGIAGHLQRLAGEGE